MHPNPLGIEVSHVVLEYEERINDYVTCVSTHQTQILDAFIPIRYRLRTPLPAGKYAHETLQFEHLHPDGNTLLAPQFGRHNALSYRILPFLASFREKYEIVSFRRRLLVDAGAADFVEGSKKLLDMYQHSARFTEAFLIDPRLVEADIPLSYRLAYNITRVTNFIRVGTREESSDLLSMLASSTWAIHEEDFVVLKFDVDIPDIDSSSIEWGFLADLVYSPQHLRLVDEIFIEMHFFYPQLWGSRFAEHTMWQHFDVLRQLRALGVAIHVWP
eukprot:CAMPEP_0179466910 /NCGR_PEP_ID=MMETSP0799-20121207/48152_1 /TAXON_ID=46947 /ORGANISM="Geminigera cryophila, Strain CCMP2564" /LENGTH=272 /DNA_ID=CAMNT_0021272017 /DNA_START=40 /DNA_END=858 /DNA_ORIENTATION=+